MLHPVKILTILWRSKKHVATYNWCYLDVLDIERLLAECVSFSHAPYELGATMPYI